MVIVIGWCLCRECGDLEYRRLYPEFKCLGGIEANCLYLWCAKGEFDA